MFGSMQIKQEYGEADDKNIQNTAGPQDVVDCMVFENQNLQCSYHQLPQFWDQALQVQACNQYSKNHCQKVDSSMDMSRVGSNPNVPAASASYINQQVHLQQQQNNAFAISQLIPDIQAHANSKNPCNSNPDLIPSATVTNGGLIDSIAAEVTIENKPKSSGRPKKTSPSGSVKKCQCEICFKEFGHKSNLFIHMRTHNGERPHKCKECGKSFTHSGNLAIHMRTHSGERPYTCQICGKTFSHSGNLSTHQRTHSGVKPFKCRICAKEFRHSGNLSIHERIHSGIKPFQCKECGKEFYHSGNLSTHFKKHGLSAGVINNIPVSNANYVNINTDKKEDPLALSSNNTKSPLSNESEALVPENPRKNQMQIDTFM